MTKTATNSDMDWKEMLASLNVPKGTEGDEDENNSTGKIADGGGNKPSVQTEKLHIILDKKGRKGKVATIIEGFTIPDEEVEALASELKRKIGTGGSARGGEILLQGDWRSRVAELLKARNFRIANVTS